MKGPFIRSDAVLVPSSHFYDAAGARALQLHLTFDIAGPPDGNPPASRERFETFLNDAPAMEFRLCAVDSADPDAALLARVGPAPQPIANAVLSWLDERTTIWHRDPAEAASQRLLSAGDLLAASANWAPTLARDTGLVATLLLPAGADTTNKIVLPHPAGFVPTGIKWVREDDDLYAVFDINPVSKESYTVRVMVLDEVPPKGNEIVDATSALLTTAGGASPDEQSHLVHEMLGALSLCGASQLSAAHALLGVTWPHFGAAETADPAKRDFGRFVFRGVAALSSLFDPILLSLVMPGAHDEGPFIGALITALEEEIAEVKPPRALDDKLVDATIINLKSRIAARMTASPADRTTFANELRTLLQDAPKPEESSGDPFWSVLLDHFVKYDPGTAPVWHEVFGDRTADDVEHQLSAELGRLLQWLESEDGCELVALAMMRASLSAEVPGELSLDDKKLALAALGARMRGDFHGADAARAAVGSLLTDAFVKAARARDQYWSADDLRAVLAEDASNWFVARIWKAARTGSVFEPILTVLPTIDPGFLDPGDADPGAATGPLADQLTAAWHDTRRHLLGNSDQLRFAASAIPLPLPVRINADADVDDGDIFAHNYAGLGVLIRRATSAGEGAWAHANLATFVLPEAPQGAPDPDPLEMPLWVQPLDPAAVNGRRQLFHNYNGFAFFEADLGPNPAGKAAVHNTPYHSLDAPHLVQLDSAKLALLPALAYGSTYELAAFAILRGGLLPTALAVPGLPWQPKPGDLEIAKDFIAQRTYSRTTMIGAVQLSGEGLQYSNEPGSGVQPLTDDYPRKGFASHGEASWFELWRSSDGSGAITLPATGDTIRLTLDDIAVWGADARIGIHIQSDRNSLLPNANAPQLSALVPAACAGQRLELVITNIGGAISYKLGSSSGITVTAATHQPGSTGVGGDVKVPVFLRLSLAVGAGPVSLSFADPAQALRRDDDASSKSGLKVMLAAPTAEFTAPKGKQKVTFKLGYPRVTYQDFERWLSNSKLAGSLIKKETDVAALLNLLLRSCIAGEAKLAERIASLPDPAVRHLLIELTPLDGLADAPAALAKKHKAIHEVITLASLDAVAQATTLDRMFAVIDEAFGAEWTIASGDFKIDPKARTVFVPEGMTAQLSVKPLVLAELFAGTPALDSRLLQWAQGETKIKAAGDALAYIFEGPARVIEMMASFADTLSKFAKPALDFVGVRNSGAPRSYELLATQPAKSGDDDWQWRRFASAEIKVQQWRYMGRPIMHWFDPKALSHDSAPGRAAIRLDRIDEKGGDDFDRFEAEAFLDRDDDDAQLYNVRLSPLDLCLPGGAGAPSTSLHAFEWSDASATMVRHRLALYSRYLGALARPTRGRVDVIGAARPPAERPDWLRVIVLADAARLELTRPQLRALIPLTVASDISRPPPVMALLDEAPLAHGGLAGRIAASIRTGLGYTVPAPDQVEPNPVLELEDARAEFGPDPQLRYRPTEVAAAQALTLLPEGPIGLTFDDSSVRAPAFANCAMILTPHILSRASAEKEADLQEHFLSVALRRYLDHRWIVDEPPLASAELDPGRSWWFECSDTETLSYDGMALCTITRADEKWTVAVADRKFVFFWGKSVEPLALAAIDADQAERIALLHQPLANGRASLTVFALPSKAAVDLGIADTPLALASVEWSGQGAAQHGGKLAGSSGLRAHPTLASAETPMNWVRTARDADRVTLADAAGASAPCHVRELTIVASKAAITPRSSVVLGSYHLRPAHEGSKEVLELQRHLALIKMRPLAGPGQTIETYEGTQLIIGAQLPIAAGDAGALARIAELEVKAVPIGIAATLTSRLREYKSAHFDLAAIGREDADTLAFWIRPARDFRRLGANFSLTFDLDGLAGSPWPTRRIDIRPTGGAALDCRTILLCANKDAVRAWFVKADGQLVEAVHPTIVNSDVATHDNQETVRISDLAASDNGGAYQVWWADIAMLTLKAMPPGGSTPKIELDYDWLFTGTLDRPADAVSPLGIMAMKGAQARLFGPSDPIDIV